MDAPAIAQAYERLIENFLGWAQVEENVRAAVVIGSRARTDHPADAFSDLDVILVVQDMQPLVEDPAWARCAGRPWLTFIERTGDGQSWERRVLYEGGLDVDFAFVPLEHAQILRAAGSSAQMPDIMQRGYRVLLDKDGLLAGLPPSPGRGSPHEAVSQAEFLNLVNDFWYHTVWTAKHLRRGELWWGKGCCDDYLKGLLRRMLEWHAQATRPGADTWLRGRFLEEWADPRALAALPHTYAHYQVDDIWRALFVTIDLFAWLEQETAQRLGFPRPLEGEAQAAALTRQLFEGR